jgi:hypothetical protein
VWGSPTEAKVFNPNIGKLDPKIVSCYFISYLEKSKGFRFYYLDRYTKFVEIRHVVFLEDEMMRESMVAREIVLIAPTVRDTIVPTPVVSSLMTTMHDNEEPVPQDPMQTDVIDEGEQQ